MNKRKLEESQRDHKYKRKRKPPESFSFLHPKEAKRLNKALQLSIEEKKLKTVNDKLRDNTISKKKKEKPITWINVEQKNISYYCPRCKKTIKLKTKNGIDGHHKYCTEEVIKRKYKCDLCPEEPGWAGPSGIWYHMKRRHGIETRPYSKKKGNKKKVSKKKVLYSEAKMLLNLNKKVKQKKRRYASSHQDIVKTEKKFYKCNKCTYKGAYPSHLQQHRASVHKINPTWYKCSMCDYKTTRYGDLKRHLKGKKHNPTVCIDGFLIEELDRSLIDKDIDVVYHKCDVPGCTYKAKQPNTLKRHKMNIHDIDVTYYHCDVSGCTYKTKQKSDVKSHQAAIHDIDVVYHKCDVPDCEYKTKQKGDVKRHKANIHGIDVVYYRCDVSGCTYKTKQKNSIKIHKAYIHNIDVKYYQCDIPGCKYKAKQPCTLKRHKLHTHIIYDESKKISIYNSPKRRACIARFMEKRKKRNWTKRTIYDVRKKTANSRPRVKGRFL